MLSEGEASYIRLAIMRLARLPGGDARRSITEEFASI